MGTGTWGNWDMMGFGGGWPWFMGFHGILGLLLIAAIAVIIVALMRDRRRDQADDPALRALKTRYATGEIDLPLNEDDVRAAMKKDLG